MDKTFTDIEQLERYHKGQCNEKEKREVENRLAVDKDFRDLFEDIELLEESLGLSKSTEGIDEKIERLRHLIDEDENAPEVTFPTPEKDNGKGTLVISIPELMNQYRVAIAASVALLLAAIIVFKPFDRNLTFSELALSYYEPPGTLAKTMSQSEVQWAIGIEAFNKRDYLAAIEAWEKIQLRSFEQDYFLAHCYFNVDGNLPKSISLFGFLTEGTSTYSYPSEWYLSLAFLRSNDVSSTIDQLDKIINDPDHPYKSDAIKLKADIAKMK